MDKTYPDLCNHPTNREYDLVTGKYVLIRGCYFNRLPGKPCGPEGKLYDEIL